jgi:hypothetical protein
MYYTSCLFQPEHRSYSAGLSLRYSRKSDSQPGTNDKAEVQSRIPGIYTSRRFHLLHQDEALKCLGERRAV